MSTGALKVALTFTAIDAASTVAKAIENRIVGMGEAAKQTRRDFDSMISNMAAGLKAFAATTYTFHLMMRGVHAAADMQAAMTDLENSMHKSYLYGAKLQETLEKVRDVAGKIQEIFPYGQKQFVEAATVFAQSGMKPSDILAPKGALYAAGATATLANSTPAAMAEQIAQIGAVFGLKASQYGELAEVMAKIHHSSLLKIPDMAVALQEPGSLARSLGIGYKDFFTALDDLVQHGVDPSRAGDEFAEFLSRTTMHTKKMEEAMKRAGIHFYEHGKRLPFVDLIHELQNWKNTAVARAMTQEQRDAVWKNIFGERPGRAANMFADTGENSFQNVEDRWKESVGIADMIDARLKDFNVQMDALKGTAQTLAGDAFDPMLHSLTEMVKVANLLVGDLDEVARKYRGITKWGDRLVEVGIGGIATVGLVRMIKGLKAGGRVFKDLMRGGSTVTGIAEGLALKKAVGVTPVFVTNWHDGIGGWPAIKPPGGSETETADAASILKSIPAAVLASAALSTAAIAGAGLMAIFGAAYFSNPLGRAFNEFGEVFHKNTTLDALKHEARASEAIAKRVEQFVAHQKDAKQPITLNIHIDEKGKIIATGDMHTIPKINLRRGVFIHNGGNGND